MNVLIIFFLTLMLNCFKPSCKMEFQFFYLHFVACFFTKIAFYLHFHKQPRFGQIAFHTVCHEVRLCIRDVYFWVAFDHLRSEWRFLRQLGKYWKVAWARAQNQTTITKFTLSKSVKRSVGLTTKAITMKTQSLMVNACSNCMIKRKYHF